jgi:hypothetical protein
VNPFTNPQKFFGTSSFWGYTKKNEVRHQRCIPLSLRLVPRMCKAAECRIKHMQPGDPNLWCCVGAISPQLYPHLCPQLFVGRMSMIGFFMGLINEMQSGLGPIGQVRVDSGGA